MWPMPIREILDRRLITGEDRKRAKGEERKEPFKRNAVEVEAIVQHRQIHYNIDHTDTLLKSEVSISNFKIGRE
jgi:hypothetical protein